MFLVAPGLKMRIFDGEKLFECGKWENLVGLEKCAKFAFVFKVFTEN
jgi:hypothetical protein